MGNRFCSVQTHVFRKSMFTNLKNIKAKFIILANADRIQALGMGDILFTSTTSDGVFSVILKDVLYVPQIAANLLSVKRLTLNGADVNFNSKNCIIKNFLNIKPF